MKSLIGTAVVVAIWYVIAAAGIFPEFILPGPTRVLESFRWSMIDGVFATTARTLTGFVAGVVFAYLIVGLASFFNVVDSIDAQLAASRAVPMLAAMPLFILWFGFGEFSRILVVTLSAVAFTAGPLAEASRLLPREWTQLRERLGKGRIWAFINIGVPGTFGSMIGALRVAFAVAFTVAIASDFMGSTVGLGRSIDSARVTFNVPAVFLLLLISAVLGLLLDACLTYVLRRIGHWVGSTSKG